MAVRRVFLTGTEHPQCLRERVDVGHRRVRGLRVTEHLVGHVVDWSKGSSLLGKPLEVGNRYQSEVTHNPLSIVAVEVVRLDIAMSHTMVFLETRQGDGDGRNGGHNLCDRRPI